MKKYNLGEGCVVTGTAGFVGSHLAERLLAQGYRVIGVDNFFSGLPENLAHFINHPKFSFYQCSITKPGLVDTLKRSHPYLRHWFHLAAIVSVPYSLSHARETMEVNYHATVRLLKEAARNGFRTFIMAGSAAEYGNDQRLPLKEEFATAATVHLSPYGRSKYMASTMVASTPAAVALRFFNIYGPRQDPNSPYSGVISRFVDLSLAGQSLTVFGDGRQTRDFVYVSDVVDAYLAALNPAGVSTPASGRLYNVGTGKRTTIIDLAEMLQQLTGNRKPIALAPERSGDIRHSVAAIDNFRRDSGWQAKVSLREGLQKTIEWRCKQNKQLETLASHSTF